MVPAVAVRVGSSGGAMAAAAAHGPSTSLRLRSRLIVHIAHTSKRYRRHPAHLCSGRGSQLARRR